MTKSGTTSDVIDAFKQRGFTFVGNTTDGRLRLHGHLTPAQSGKGYRCAIELDPNFFELPRIRLLELPPDSPAVVPHLGADGHLCYAAKGTVVLDIFDPVGQALACLNRAEEVFTKIVAGELVQDLEEEFHAFWCGDFCLLDIQGSALGQHPCRVLDGQGRLLFCVTDDPERTSKKFKGFVPRPEDAQSIVAYRVQTNVQPRPLVNQWPPQTVGALLDWQSKLDTRCRRKIHARIRDALAAKAKGVLILIESPRMTYGVSIIFDGIAASLTKKVKTLAHRRDPTLALRVTPVAVARIDDSYLAQRNVPDRTTLASKSIALVGCGTIGGYLAELLLKAGAGTCGGKLSLVDMDVLMPQNLGRHRLGCTDLFSNKATSLANELLRLVPTATIQPLPVDVKQARLDDGLDLLIDATGEEALGHWLCQHYLRRTAMLSVWIEGPGTVVRGLLHTSAAGACYRCLWHSVRRGALRPTTEEVPVILAGQGCEDLYVPFPSTVSVQAASLGAEMALDWANGSQSPALRTRLTDRRYHLETPDADPPPDSNCPICRT